jgi:NHLM bacteriocin system ABC transporter ATP-binding protein
MTGSQVVRTLAANSPLPLDEPDAAWLVEAGRAQVFAVLTGTGRPEARHSLFDVGPGELLLPPAPGSPVTLLAVGIEDGTSARLLAAADLRRAARSDGGATAVRVEAWLDRLADAVAASLPEAGRSLARSEEAVLTPGLAAWPATRTVWVRALAPLRPYGREEAPAEAFVPVPEQSWVVATDEEAVVPTGAADALAADESWSGVAAFERAVYGQLGEHLAVADVEAERRIDERGRAEQALRAETYTSLGAVLSDRAAQELAGEGDPLLAAMRSVGRSLGVAIVPPPRGASGGVVDPVDAIARASGVRTRKVLLEGGWWKRDVGPLLGRLAADGRAVGLCPRRGGRYELVDPAASARMPVDGTVAALLEPEATMVYRPLPARALTRRDVLRYVVFPVAGDLRRLILFGLLAGGLSLVPPIVTKHIFSTVVPGLQRGNLLWLAGLLAVFSISSFGFALAQQLSLLRLEGRASTDLQSALWDRLLDLPLPFFRRFSAGTLTMRVMGIEQIRSLATATVATAALAIPVAVANLVLAFVLAPVLAAFGVIALALIAVSLVLLVRFQIEKQSRIQRATQELFAIAMQLVDAVGKLRVADAEQRGYAQWARRFAALKQSFYDAQLGFAATTAFTAAANAIATALFIVGAWTLTPTAISPATFIAFNGAFLQVIAAVVGLTSVATFFAQAAPIYEQAEPIMEQPRETDTLRTDPGELRGMIEVSHVSLRYSADGPLVLDDVSFTAEPGEYIAFVGPSGAGKSSLLRVLLGFEAPEVGSVRFDGKELESIDPHAVRRQIGVVNQTAQLLPGDIFTNIVGARPLTMEDAWHAARIAGFADEIEELPMGMQTFVSEGGAFFSGGQRQRLLIARAVAGHPRILLFDEATSALDNRTQHQVANAIERLRATRIVIAHRLSTVRRADRIIVLDTGRVVQEGAADELLEVDGPFRRLALRQLV